MTQSDQHSRIVRAVYAPPRCPVSDGDVGGRCASAASVQITLGTWTDREVFLTVCSFHADALEPDE